MQNKKIHRWLLYGRPNRRAKILFSVKIQAFVKRFWYRFLQGKFMIQEFILTHFMLLSSFDTSGFLMFSGGTKRDQWHEMG